MPPSPSFVDGNQQGPSAYIVRDFQDSHDETISIRVEKPQPTRVITVRPGDEFNWNQLSSGTYYHFSGEFHLDEEIRFRDLHDVILDGSGSAKIWFSDPYSYGISIVRCKRLSLRNFASIALDTTKAALFSVVSFNGEGRGEFPGSLPPHTPVRTVSTYTAENTWGWDDRSTWKERYFIDGTTVANLPPLTSFSNTTVLIRHHTYTRNALGLRDCDHIQLDNVNIGSGPGMGITAERSHHLFLHQLSISPSPGQPASTASDGFHASGVTDVVVEACEFSYMGDDSINIHTKILPVVRNNPRGTDLRWVGSPDRLWQFKIAVGEPSSTDPSRPRTVVYYDDSMQLLGSGVVHSVTVHPHPVLTVKEPSPEAVFFLILQDTVSQRILLQDNYFHHHRARGILIQAQDVSIRGNRIEHVSLNGILVEPDAFYWMEGLGLGNAMITDNHFAHTGAAISDIVAAAISILPMRIAREQWQQGFHRDICVSNSNSFVNVHGNKTSIPEGRTIC